jgi:putative permease
MNPGNSINTFFRLLLIAAILAATVYAFNFLIDMVAISLPFIFAFIVNFLLSPLVKRLEKTGLPRSISVIVVFMGFCVVSVFMLWLTFTYLYVEITALVERSPIGIAKISSWIQTLHADLADKIPSLANFDIQKTLIEQGKLIAPDALAGTPQFLADIILVLMLTPVFTFFLVRDGGNIKRWFISLAPNKYFEMTLTMIYRINEQMGDYIRGRFYEATIVGFLTFIAIGVFGFPHAGLYAVTAAITNVIPYVGPLLCIAIGLFIAMVEHASFESVLYIGIIISVIQLLDLSLIYPLAIGITVQLHPLVVILAVIFGSKFMGIIGLILAVPVVSVIKVLFTELRESLWRYRPDRQHNSLRQI